MGLKATDNNINYGKMKRNSCIEFKISETGGCRRQNEMNTAAH